MLGLLMRKPVIVEHHGFQTICPTGQLFMERTKTPCPGHFMAGRHGECLRCRSDSNRLHSWKLWLSTFVRRFLCERVAANVTPTEWLASLLHLSNTKAIPHGLKSAPSPGRRPVDPPAIVFQGRLVSTKGIKLLLDAATILRSQNRSFELLVIGDGPERGPLEEYVQKRGLSSCVSFMGRLDEADLESAFAKASMVVVPSLGGEVFGLVVAENMARELPIVASDLGSFVEVAGDTALTFRTGDAQDLARKVEHLLEEPTLGTAMGARAKQRLLQTYPLDRMIDAHARLYHELCHLELAT